MVGIFTAVISGGLTGRIVKWLGEKRTLYIGQFFGAVGMMIAGLARTGAMLHGLDPGDFDVEYFFPSRARNDDSSRERARTRRTAGRNPEPTFNRVRDRAISVLLDFRVVQSIRTIGIHIPGAGYFLAAALLFTAMVMATRVEQPRFAVPVGN